MVVRSFSWYRKVHTHVTKLTVPIFSFCTSDILRTNFQLAVAALARGGVYNPLAGCCSESCPSGGRGCLCIMR